MYKYLLVLAFISCATAQITKFQWSLCSSGVIDFYNFDVTPMVSFKYCFKKNNFVFYNFKFFYSQFLTLVL